MAVPSASSTSAGGAAAAASSSSTKSERELNFSAAQVASRLEETGDATATLLSFYRSHSAAQARSSSALEAKLLSSAPSYVSLHDQLRSSLNLLSDLSTFLLTFRNDLTSVSTQIQELRDRSRDLDRRLKARRELEAKLGHLIQRITISPRLVAVLFDAEPDPGWAGLLAQLEETLTATAEIMAGVDDGSGSGTAASEVLGPEGIKAVKEAREVAEGCKVMAATKLRPYLLAPLATIRTSLSTNVQILQTSILLKHHAPLYAFLARQMPAAAVDVQKGYTAAARLYFETGFRRYARSLGLARERAKKSIAALGKVGLTDVSRRQAEAATAFVSKAGAQAFGAPSLSTTWADVEDPWLSGTDNLANGGIDDGPAVTLAYQAEDPKHRVSLEGLYRSLSLAFLDNATSEFAFLVRFFDNLGGGELNGAASSADAGGDDVARAGESQVTASGVSRARTRKTATATINEDDDEGPAPEESASAAGDAVREREEEAEAEEQRWRDAEANDAGSMTRLSLLEQRKLLNHRGSAAASAAPKMWKQIMEPVIGHWNTFSRSLLSPTPPLLSLLTMMRLTETMLLACEQRGASSVLLPTLQAFKMEAYPLLQKAFGEQIESVKKLASSAGGGSGSGGGTSGGGAAAASASEGVMAGLLRSAAALGGGSTTVVPDDHVITVCLRYAYLFGSVVRLTTGAISTLTAVALTPGGDTRTPTTAGATKQAEEEADDAMLFGNLLRLRNEVERLVLARSSVIAKEPGGAARGAALTATACNAALRGLETGPATVSQPRMQAELSHWTELKRVGRLSAAAGAGAGAAASGK